MKELVYENRRITVHELPNLLRISFGAVQSILKDCLNVCWAATKYVSHLLSEEKEMVISAFARTFKGGLEDMQNPF